MAKKKTFESALEQMEQIAQTLEDSQHDLSKSIALYQEGLALADFCRKELEEAKTKVTQLTLNEEGQMSEKEFVVEEGADDL